MKTRDPRRLAVAAGLLVLAPMCAEYVTGYDDSTGDPLVLAASLLIFSPLYGAPALLIREAARRLGMPWPGILALTAAFGVLQAGVIDQSMFSEGYRDIPYWEEMIRPTYVEPLGLAAYTTLSFVAGHAIWSFGVPIALTEALSPRLSRTPWLRTPGLVTAAVLYLAAAAFVLREHLRTEPDHATAGQVAGSLTVVALLVLVALISAVRRRRRAELPAPPGGTAPRPIVVAVAGLVAGLLFNFLPSTWAGVVAGLAVIALCAAAAVRLARSPEWSVRHAAALAAGALTARAAVGFFAVPLGEVAPVAKYAHNVAFLAGAMLLGVLTTRRRGTA
ncbi:hypothetical protein IL992_27470 [Microbispora sp. NEAU-D428]|uniref:hypothetical protein n=1 Tax=Microbispora sitophila TaxID=2771537 RepID=UPI0018666925|nr:hypothetical protein [Microbispora sitophila]MBE3012896.1 hypothetical protein [Microbispora sitophila]